MATKKTNAGTKKTEEQVLDFVQKVMEFMGDEPVSSGDYEVNLVSGGVVKKNEVSIIFPDGKKEIDSFEYSLYKDIFKNMIKTVRNALAVKSGFKENKRDAFFIAGDGKKCKLVDRVFIKHPNRIENQIDGFKSGNEVEAVSRSNITRESIYETGKSIGFIVFYVTIKYKKQGVDNEIFQWFKINTAIGKKQKGKNDSASPLDTPEGDSL
jgi:hypothetical protein